MGKMVLPLYLFTFLPLSMMAQDDDMYFVPTKENVAKEAKSYGLPKNTYYSGSDRSVDDYNRRAWSSVVPIDSAGNDIIDFSAVRGVYQEDTLFQEQADNDYRYTRQMSRFDEDYSPSSAYWEGYKAGRWSSPWYYSRWYGGWYDPWYYGDPWFYSNWYGPSWYYGGWYGGWYAGWYDYYRPYYYGGWYGPGYWGGAVVHRGAGAGMRANRNVASGSRTYSNGGRATYRNGSFGNGSTMRNGSFGSSRNTNRSSGSYSNGSFDNGSSRSSSFGGGSSSGSFGGGSRGGSRGGGSFGRGR